MRNRFFIASCLIVITLGMITVAFPEGIAAILLVLVLSTISLLIFRKFTDEREFLTSIFLWALLVRLGFGVFIHVFDLRDFFGGDAHTYDFNGWRLVEYWTGNVASDDLAAERAWSTSGPGWGMNYLVGAIYFVLGKKYFCGPIILRRFWQPLPPRWFISVRCGCLVINGLRKPRPSRLLFSRRLLSGHRSL